MKINWGRVINAGLVIEILFVGLYQIFIELHSMGDWANMVFVIAGSFVFMLLGALWVARKIESRYILHGFLVGVVAIVYYVIRSLPDVISGEYQNYWLTALWGHTPKLLGGIVGGYLAARRRKNSV